MMFVIYVCSLTRAIIALHTLIDNKISNRELERLEEKEKLGKPDGKEKDEKAPAEKD